MNTHSLPSSFNLLEPQKNCQKMRSPSYTNTTQTLSSSFQKMTSPSIPHSQSQSQSKHTNQTSRQQNFTQKPSMTLESEQSPLISIENIKWGKHQDLFTSEMELKVQYIVTKQLQENITWKVVYLGSAFSQSYDQTLCEFQTQENDPSSSYPQKRQFKITVQPPKWNLISSQQLFNISALVVSAHYKKQQFLKVGFYVHYQLPSLSKEETSLLSRLQNAQNSHKKQDKIKKSLKTKKISKKPQKPLSSKHECVIDSNNEEIMTNILKRTVRTILGDKPRVTKFQINWEKQNIAQNPMKMQSQSQPSINLNSQHLITEYTKIITAETLSASSQ